MDQSPKKNQLNFEIGKQHIMYFKNKNMNRGKNNLSTSVGFDQVDSTMDKI